MKLMEKIPSKWLMEEMMGNDGVEEKEEVHQYLE